MSAQQRQEPSPAPGVAEAVAAQEPAAAGTATRVGELLPWRLARQLVPRPRPGLVTLAVRLEGSGPRSRRKAAIVEAWRRAADDAGHGGQGARPWDLVLLADRPAAELGALRRRLGAAGVRTWPRPPEGLLAALGLGRGGDVAVAADYALLRVPAGGVEAASERPAVRLLWRARLALPERRMLDRAVTGALDLQDVRFLAAWRRRLASRSRSAHDADVADPEEADWLSWHWLWWAETVRARPSGVRAALPVAAERLADAPSWFARFALEATRHNPVLVRSRPLRATVLDGLARDPLDPACVLAAIAWAVEEAPTAVAEAWAVRALEAAKSDAALGRELALAAARRAHASGTLAWVAAWGADLADPDGRDGKMVDVRFRTAWSGARDRDGAAVAARELIALHRGDLHWLNGFAWKLMTHAEYEGAFDAVAAEACDAMVEVDGWRTCWRLDTVALARFRSGDVAQAVRLQEEAVRRSTGDTARARYLERLVQYRAALGAASPGR